MNRTKCPAIQDRVSGKESDKVSGVSGKCPEHSKFNKLVCFGGEKFKERNERKKERTKERKKAKKETLRFSDRVSDEAERREIHAA